MTHNIFLKVNIFIALALTLYLLSNISENRQLFAKLDSFPELAAKKDVPVEKSALLSGIPLPVYIPGCIKKASLTEKYIALTFDDGPHVGYTAQILEILKSKNAVATFFVVGRQAVLHTDLLLLQFGSGNEIANHSFNHNNMSGMSEEQIAAELTKTQELIQNITGAKTRFFRPPGGNCSPKVLTIASALGYSTVLWSRNSYDIKSPGSGKIVARAVDRIAPGDIILLHDGIDQTVKALPEIIDRLRAKGYTFVTLSSLFDCSKKSEAAYRKRARRTV